MAEIPIGVIAEFVTDVVAGALGEVVARMLALFFGRF